MSRYSDLIYFIDSRKRLHIYLGPMGLVITAKTKRRSIFEDENVIKRTVSFAVEIFEDVANYKDIISSWTRPLNNPKNYPIVIRKMISAALVGQRISKDKTTPLICVAGAIAECVLEKLDPIAEYIIVNNYGDLALKIDRAKIGLLDSRGNMFGTFDLNTPTIRGICTSGFGGRSFSKGVSDATICLHDSASLADTFSTLIGNKVITNSPKIKLDYAENLDPSTDIKGEKVVVDFEGLDEAEVFDAMKNGLSLARKAKVPCAIVKLGEFVGVYPKSMRKNINLLENYQFIDIF